MNRPLDTQEVLTLAGAARYLHLKQAQVRALAEKREIPARQVDGEWRFLKVALQDWLRGKPVRSADAFIRQAGTFKDDDMLPQILEDIYRARGRPMTEE